MNDIKPIIIKVDLGIKGVFYRLQAGPFYKKSEAVIFCNKLQKLKQACFVVSN